MLIVFFAEQSVTPGIERSYLLAQVARQRELQPPATSNEVIRAGMLHTRSLAEAVSERVGETHNRRRRTENNGPPGTRDGPCSPVPTKPRREWNPSAGGIGQAALPPATPSNGRFRERRLATCGTGRVGGVCGIA